MPHQFKIDQDNPLKARLPEKKPGRHRFIAIASYVVEGIDEKDQLILDQENLWHVSFGCIDCEQPYKKDMRRFCDAPEYVDPEDSDE